MTVPELTAEQRAAALAKATEARRARAEVKGSLKSGELELSEFLKRAESVEALGKMKVVTLLGSLPGIGNSTARSLMAEYAIAPTRRVRGLGPHQRSRLTGRFG